MSRKIVLYKRKTAIIFTDCLLFSLGLSIYGVSFFKYHWSIGVVTFIGLLLGFFYSFFSFRIFRYVMSIVFSLLYAGIFAFIGASIDKENSTTPAIVFGILAFTISLYLHKDHFSFLKGAKYYEYDKY
ncbi:MAG: hypothetical protein KBH03_07020 [Paludibacteraceae bacterium]|jgi:hypothetical protein|nr:hypothetical protein [Paludibacteraceae bacterium]